MKPRTPARPDPHRDRLRGRAGLFARSTRGAFGHPGPAIEATRPRRRIPPALLLLAAAGLCLALILARR